MECKITKPRKEKEEVVQKLVQVTENKEQKTEQEKVRQKKASDAKEKKENKKEMKVEKPAARSKSVARCKNRFLMTTVQETTNINKLIIFCFSVDDTDRQLLSKLKADKECRQMPKKECSKVKERQCETVQKEECQNVPTRAAEGKLSMFTKN